MPQTAEMEVLVKLKADAKQLQKDIEGAMSGISLGGGAGGGAGGTKKSNTMLGNMSSGLKGMGRILGKIFATVSIVAGLIAVLDPVFKVLNLIIKMVGEFLRPISDVLLILLMPVLSILKPILMVFRALMAPFRKLAFRGMAAANKMIGTGMKMEMEGLGGGGLLIAEGIATALASAGYLLLPIIDLITAPTRKIIGFILDGISFVAQAVLKAFGASGAAGKVDTFFGTLKTKITGGVNDAGSALNDVKLALEEVIEKQIEFSDAVSDVKSALGVEGLSKVLTDTGTDVTNFKDKITELSDELKKDGIPPGIPGVNMSVETGVGGMSMLPPEEAEKKGFFGKIKDFFAGFDFGLMMEQLRETIKVIISVKDMYVAAIDIQKAQTEAAFDKKDGTVIKSFKVGLSTMTQSSNNFASETSNIASIIDDAAARVKTAVQNYYNAMDEISRLKEERRRRSKRR